jgi:hypothetical protein
MCIANSLIISLWSAAVLLLGTAQGFVFIPYVNADALYPLTFVSDVVSMASPFRWIVAPVNGLFPDEIVVLIGKMVGADMGLNFVFYAAVYYVLVFLSATFFLSSCKADVEVACTASAATLILTIFGKSQLDMIAFTMSAPVHHGGVLPIALLVFGLMVREIGDASSRWRRAAAAGLMAAVVFTDIIAIVHIVVPVAALFLLLFLLWHHLRANLAFFVASVLAGSGFGWVARFLLDQLPWIQLGTTEVSRAYFGDGWVDFLREFPAIAVSNLGLIHAAVAAIGLILGPIVAAYELVKLGEMRVEAVGRCLLGMAAIAAIAGPVFAGTFPNMGATIIRYQVPGLILPVLWVCWVVITYIIKLASGRLIITTLVALGAFGSLAQELGGNGFDASDFLRDYKARARELQPIGADLILAEYWDAKPLHMVSKLPICEATPNGNVYPWITNLGWCDNAFGAWRENRGIVLIGGAQSEPSEIVTTYGQPTRRIFVSGSHFLIYSWSEQLQERVKASICNAYASFPIKPTYC